MSLPALPVKVEAEFEHSNGYGEPPAKRANTGATIPPVSSASRNQVNTASSSGSVDANVTLWQFLLDLLLKQQYSNIICWTNNEGEFKLLDAEQVAKLWGLKKNKNNMNYDKLSRALRYYYDKNIIKKVMGQKFVYKFVSFPEMVKTENRIPFKKKMESIVNDSNPVPTSTATMGSNCFSTLRPYDVKSGLIQQAQLAATAALAQQQQLLHQHAVQAAHAQVAQAAAQAAMVETKYQIPAEHRALYHNSQDSSQSKMSPETSDHQQMPTRSPSCSPTPNVSSNITGSQYPTHLNPQTQHSPHHTLAERHTLVPTPPAPQAPPLSPPQTPVSVCTPAGSPSAAPVFELPGSGTPTPPPKPITPVQHREAEVKVKLEIPEFDDNRNCETAVNGSIGERRNSKQSKLKPDPLSISNDVVVNHSVTSPLMNRGILPSLNTPMFLTSPMFGQRTPLIPGIFWGPGTLSPVTLSPRFGSGLHAAPAFQFPAFAVSPAQLASFSTFHDSVFTSAAASGPSNNGDKKLS